MDRSDPAPDGRRSELRLSARGIHDHATARAMVFAAEIAVESAFHELGRQLWEL